eukprot:g5192.t1
MDPFLLFSLFLLLPSRIIRGHELKENFELVQLDHFNLVSNTTFPLRYLIDSQYFNKTSGPLLIYTGNEGNIETFVNSTGFMWMAAERMQGLIVFVEERYFGKSVPTLGKQYEFLSTAQVVADYASVVSKLKIQYHVKNAIAVGGSYGGMISAYLRRKHPFIVNAALASSAPVLGFSSTLTKNSCVTKFWEKVESVFPCSPLLRQGYDAIWKAGQTHNRKLLRRYTETFNLCKSLDTVKDVENLIGLIQHLHSSVAIINYPYDFIAFNGKEMPANPTKYSCMEAQKAGDAVSALYQSIKWLLPEAEKCTSVDDFFAYIPGSIAGPWTFQRCVDFVMGFSVSEDSKMFLPCSKFSKNCWPGNEENPNALPNGFRNFCSEKFGVTIRAPSDQQLLFGSDWTRSQMETLATADQGVQCNSDIQFGSSKIVFTNGSKDPWSYGGLPPTKSVNVEEEIRSGRSVSFLIEDAAHHLDLRKPMQNDPDSVKNQREQTLKILEYWINDNLY